MNTYFRFANNLLLPAFAAFLVVSCAPKESSFSLSHSSESTVIAYDGLGGTEEYLLLPIQDDAPVVPMQYKSADDGEITLMVRFARERVDYTMPLQLNGPQDIVVNKIDSTAIAWQKLTLADQYVTGDDEYRPSYHFAPHHGWMNDPNGMVYKDGEYHLFYQHNPYASNWSNMHWGHAVSRDLVNWEHLPDALAPDSLGQIYSGSCIVDKYNAAGWGKDAIIAFYTSHGKAETQCVAYSLDNGRTFIKYDKNPVLTSPSWNFRDPKVLYHASSEKYIMAVTAGTCIEFYSSTNLKEWSFESKFGETYGWHTGCVWECPDLVELPAADGSDASHWVLVVNINPGAPQGGSATQYFVGSFDGKEFVCNDEPSEVKWLDYGLDHYAAVTWANAPEDRTIAIAWMSNWQYANQVPTCWFRSANTIARDLFLFEYDGEQYVGSAPSKEIEAFRQPTTDFSTADEVCFTLERTAEPARFSMCNATGEHLDFEIDFAEGVVTVDRTMSGISDFSDAFASKIVGPLLGEDCDVRLFVDKASVELFINGGRTAMTNTVFPVEPYDQLIFAQPENASKLEMYTINPTKQ